MAQRKDPAIRSLLIERAAAMLRSREPVTLRSLVAGTGVSTMAVYTYFDGMDGLWRATRQEGFTRLATRMATVRETPDPVRDLAALGSAYLAAAVDAPDLYRVMFDTVADLDDAPAADAGFRPLVAAVERAQAAGRFGSGVDAPAVATQTWAVGHGLASLVVTGPLPPQALGYGPSMLTALFVQAGDDPAACRRSVARGWDLAIT